MNTQIDSKRKILKLFFYSGLILLILLLLISFSPLELVFLEHQLIYWRMFFYGFISTALMSIYLMISSKNIEAKMMSVPMLLLIYFILGTVIYLEKPSSQWKDSRMTIHEDKFFQEKVMQYKNASTFTPYDDKHRTIQRRTINKYLIWCEEIDNQSN